MEQQVTTQAPAAKPPAPARVEYIATRVYVQADGTYKAWIDVKRLMPDGKVEEKISESNYKPTWNEALADAMERGGLLS